jgi:hypothetical protein
MNILNWIQNWYKNQCDGDWEHASGVKIDTIDNPGWSVEIDLIDTELENKTFNKIRYDYDDDDWLLCFVENGKFQGVGDSEKLEKILLIFKEWSES